MNKLTYYCDGCPHADLELEVCTKYQDTSWVTRRCGCAFNTKGARAQASKIHVGQQKQGRRKIVAAVDLTQGGLFPEWGGIGINWKANVDLSKKVASHTPGRDKPHGKASSIARYCAKYSRAYKHRLYSSQCAKWAKGSNF